MSKSIFSVGGGALSLVESGGNFTLEVSESKSLGGGKAAGIVQAQGEGSIVLEGIVLEQLVEAYVNSKLPASLEPLAEAAESIANPAIAALE